MNKTNVKISKENREDEEGGIACLRRLTKLSIFPKFGRLALQAVFVSCLFISGYFNERGVCGSVIAYTTPERC